jgi:hypothetical protein
VKVGVPASQLHSLSLLNTLKRFQDTGNPKFGPLLKALHMCAWPTKDICAGNFHRESVVDAGRGQILEFEVPAVLHQAPGGRVERRRSHFDPPPPKAAVKFKSGSASSSESNVVDDKYAKLSQKVVEKPLRNSNVFGAEWSRTHLSEPPNRARPTSAPAHTSVDNASAAGSSLVKGPIKAVRFVVPNTRSVTESSTEGSRASGMKHEQPPLPPPQDSVRTQHNDARSEASRKRAATRPAVSARKVPNNPPKKKANSESQRCFHQPTSSSRKKQLQFFSLQDYQ